MRPSPLLLALALLAAACGGNSSSTSGRCPATPCGTGQFCQADGTCATVVVNPDGGIAACTSQSEKPVGASSLPIGASSGAYVLLHAPSVTVGQSVSFDVPSGIASITIVEQAINAPDTAKFVSGGSGVILDNVAVPHTVDGPNGSFHFDDVLDGQTLPPSSADPATYYAGLPVYFFSDSPATGTLTIPNTTAGLSLVGASGLPSGTWTAQISDYAYECAAGIGKNQTFSSCVQGAVDSTYDVTVIAKPTDTTSGGIPAGGNLEVVLNFVATSVNGVPLTAATAPNDPNVKRLVSTLRGLYLAKNINVNVTYQDAPADVQTRYASGVNIDKIGACSDLSQLLRYGAMGNVLNIFLVPALIETTSTGSATTVGIDGTIPGPASIGGTVASGAVVSAASLRDGQALCTSSPNFLDCGADETAYIIAHEAGHFLGLYHVTEKYGFEFDPLADTLPCKCTSCSRQPSTCSDPSKGTPPTNADPVDVSECLNATTGCGGGDNLMFWLLAPGSAGNLSSEQSQVMRANPLVL
jgi:hypothetical protein